MEQLNILFKILRHTSSENTVAVFMKIFLKKILLGVSGVSLEIFLSCNLPPSSFFVPLNYRFLDILVYLKLYLFWCFIFPWMLFYGDVYL